MVKQKYDIPVKSIPVKIKSKLILSMRIEKVLTFLDLNLL